MASGPFWLMRSAICSAVGSSAVGATTRLTSPISRARAASMRSPVSSISMATDIGTVDGSRIAPKPCRIDQRTSGQPKDAVSEAMRMSHPSASSSPPARQ
jgi:hypothetical protein